MTTRFALFTVFLTGLIALSPSFSFAEIESADIIPTVLSDGDKIVFSKEKAKLDELRKGLLDDIAQQNTECGQVAESNTFQVDLCRNRQSFIMSQIENYKTRLKGYREKIQRALFMAPQGKAAIQSGLVFKDIPPPAPSPEPLKDAPNEPKPVEPQTVVPSPAATLQVIDEYLNNPENNPRVQRAKEDADRFHNLHVTVSKAMVDEVNRKMAEVRAKTVSNNPRLGREEVDRIVGQDPEVRRMTATWYLVHNYTEQQAKDYEEDYVSISKEAAKELDRKRGIK